MASGATAYRLEDYLPLGAERVLALADAGLQAAGSLADLAARHAQVGELESESVRLHKESEALLGTVLGGLNRLLERARADAASGTLPELGDLLLVMEMEEQQRAAYFRSRIEAFRHVAERMAKLQSDFNRLKYPRGAVECARARVRAHASAEIMIRGLEALRDTRVELAAIDARAHGGVARASSASELADLFKSLRAS